MSVVHRSLFRAFISHQTRRLFINRERRILFPLFVLGFVMSGMGSAYAVSSTQGGDIHHEDDIGNGNGKWEMEMGSGNGVREMGSVPIKILCAIFSKVYSNAILKSKEAKVAVFVFLKKGD